MLVNVFASGSKGNATLIKTKKYNILIDAGMTAKYLNDQLANLNMNLKDIDYILITHTHYDHISSLKTIIKDAKPTIIITDKMFIDLKFLKIYEHIKIINDDLKLDNVLIESLKISHNASDSRGYIITEDDSSLVYVTDTGYLKSDYWDKLKNKSLYIFESNHDMTMLMHGKYPNWLKRKIYSDVGHLSNDVSAYHLGKLIGPNTKQIILAHLSEENNSPEIALENIKNYFSENNIEFQNIITAKQNEPLEMVEI